MKIAVVTGASSGIGREFVLQLDAQHSLQEIWVIARREQRLTELKSQCKTPIRVIALDLVKRESIAFFSRMLQEHSPTVAYLVNAAGFGKIGMFSDLAQQECQEMIELNILALTEMTKICLPYLEARAKVIHMASASAFQPLPGLGVYAASKAYVLHFSRALSLELKPRQITVTAVCPNWVDTEFIGVAKHSKDADAVIDFKNVVSAQGVVKKALCDSKKGKQISVFGKRTQLERIASKILPHSLVMQAWCKRNKQKITKH